MLWICAEHRVDIDIFVFLRTTYRVKAFSTFHTVRLVKRLGLLGGLREDTAQTDDANLPKGYSRQYGIILSIGKWAKRGEGVWSF